jgi:hypothetical protein
MPEKKCANLLVFKSFPLIVSQIIPFIIPYLPPMTTSSANHPNPEHPIDSLNPSVITGPRTGGFPIAPKWLVEVPPLPSANIYDNVK